MKILKYINAFAVGLPILLGLSEIVFDNMFAWALYSTMLTGFLQVIIAIAVFILDHKRDALCMYFIGVITFFILVYLHEGGYILCCIPPLLAIYLTIQLHSPNKTNQIHEL